MMGRFAIFFSAVVSVLASVPFDLPDEILMDVNKGEVPVVNIIADRASFMKSPLITGAESALSAMHPGESAAMIKDTLARAVEAAAVAEGLPSSEFLCARNYNGRYAGLTPAEKASVAAEKGESFPCA